MWKSESSTWDTDGENLQISTSTFKFLLFQAQDWISVTYVPCSIARYIQ